MALVIDMTCSICKEAKSVAIAAGSVAPYICDDCIVAKYRWDEKNYLETLKDKALIERIEKLESDMYNLKRRMKHISIREHVRY